jgi:hypothetical protein
VIAGAVENERSVAARGDLAADGGYISDIASALAAGITRPAATRR